MEVFVVGGSVRDILMGHTPKDIDYVVVGTNHEEMISNGFKQVGIDFPVYLHPETGEEWALARTERKTAAGYNGFETITENVTLIDDLQRRDLTINSLAVKIEDWEEFQITKSPHLVIDPFWGQADIQLRVLIHTSEAFREDPIRVLRTARFAARYNFIVQTTTMALMRDVVHELNNVPTERIWMEFEKGLMEQHPHKMIEILHEVGAFDVEIMKPFQRRPVINDEKKTRVDLLQQIDATWDLPSRFSLISMDFTHENYTSHRIPSKCVEMSAIINKHGLSLAHYNSLPPVTRLQIIMEMRVLTRPEFVHKMMDVAHVIFGTTSNKSCKQQFTQDFLNISKVNAAEIAAQWKTGSIIKEKVFEARLNALTS